MMTTDFSCAGDGEALLSAEEKIKWLTAKQGPDHA